MDGPDRVRNLQRFMTDYGWEESWMRKRHWEIAAASFMTNRECGAWTRARVAKKGAAFGRRVAPQYCGGVGQDGQLPVGGFHLLLQHKVMRSWTAGLIAQSAGLSPSSKSGASSAYSRAKRPFKPNQNSRGVAQTVIAGPTVWRCWITCDCSFGETTSRFWNSCPGISITGGDSLHAQGRVKEQAFPRS